MCSSWTAWCTCKAVEAGQRQEGTSHRAGLRPYPRLAASGARRRLRRLRSDHVQVTRRRSEWVGRLFASVRPSSFMAASSVPPLGGQGKPRPRGWTAGIAVTDVPAARFARDIGGGWTWTATAVLPQRGAPTVHACVGTSQHSRSRSLSERAALAGTGSHHRACLPWPCRALSRRRRPQARAHPRPRSRLPRRPRPRLPTRSCRIEQLLNSGSTSSTSGRQACRLPSSSVSSAWGHACSSSASRESWTTRIGTESP